MSEQISQELLKIMNEMANNEATIAKIDASIFVRDSERKINEKVAYLYNMINIEAKNFNQRQDDYYEDINIKIDSLKIVKKSMYASNILKGYKILNLLGVSLAILKHLRTG